VPLEESGTGIVSTSMMNSAWPVALMQLAVLGSAAADEPIPSAPHLEEALGGPATSVHERWTNRDAFGWFTHTHSWGRHVDDIDIALTKARAELARRGVNVQPINFPH
jgi:hypothetical protein